MFNSTSPQKKGYLIKLHISFSQATFKKFIEIFLKKALAENEIFYGKNNCGVFAAASA
jgi:hypothetical protein